jgi:ATP-dependent DNA ligase
MRLCPLHKADCKVIGFYEGKGKLKGSLGGVIVDYEEHEVRVGGGFKEKPELKQKVTEYSDLEPSLISVIEERGKGHGIDTARQNLRKYIWDNQELFLGGIAECAFKNKTKSGAMRQPRFKRWRWDK